MSESLSQPEAQRFIKDHYGDRASELSALGAGEWSQAYAFTIDGREAVVRFGVHGEDFAKDRLMASFSSPQLPIPEIIELGDTPHGYFAVSERAHGTLLDELDEAGMRAVLPAFLDALDAMRDINVSNRKGYGGWNPDGVGRHQSWPEALLAIANDLPDQRTHGWRAALEQSPTGTGPFDTAFAHLQQLVDRLPSDRHIIHGDLLNRNALVDGDHLRAIIDWGNSQYGDHLYDAAWLIYWWRWYPNWANIDIEAELLKHWETSGQTPTDLRTRLRCYQVHIGLDAQAYNAFTRRWDQLESNADHTLSLVNDE